MLNNTMPIGALIILLMISGTALSTEEAKYSVLRADGMFEIRLYEPHILAETTVDGDFEDAGSKAFRALFDYISGSNEPNQTLAMTAPVAQSSGSLSTGSQNISMTSPVGQQASNGAWTVSFMMPSEYSLETLPKPKDPNVTLRSIPKQYVATVEYSGFWSEKGYRENYQKLTQWMQKENISSLGEPIWARYNGPITPWFLRRNEILIPINPPAAGL